jgi:transposase
VSLDIKSGNFSKRPRSNDRAVGVDAGYKDKVVLSDGIRLNKSFDEIAEYLAKEYTTVCVESLSPELSYLQILLKRIESACLAAKVTFIKIDRFYPSTRLCFDCGKLTGPTQLHVRKWVCGNCGEKHDRDINAARNIRARGLKLQALAAKSC